MEFKDAISEGWLEDHPLLALFHPSFQSACQNNYSMEVFTFLYQYQFLLSLRMVMQLVWNRTVNLHGLPGRNISCDLPMRHLNRLAKDSTSELGSNITDKAIQLGEEVN